MKLNSLKPPAGSRKKRKRVGRGMGQGTGVHPARVPKARMPVQEAVSVPVLEGGQMPLARRLPKRGFRTSPKRDYRPSIFEKLKGFPAVQSLMRTALIQAGFVKRKGDGIKDFGEG